jgi:hypothetical protein
VKIGFGPHAVGSVGGRSSTAGCRGHPWGRRFRHQARHPAFVGVVALPGHVAHGLRGVVRPHPFWLEGSQRHRRLSRPIWSPAVKVAAAAKITARSVRGRQRRLGGRPFTAGHGGLREPANDDGVQEVRGPAPLGLAFPPAPSEPVMVPPSSTAPPPPSIEGIASRQPSRMPIPSFPRKTASQRRRFGYTLPSMSCLVLMRRRSLGHCRRRNFCFMSFFSTKCSFCRILSSCVWCLVSSRSFLAQSWSPPPLAEDIPSPPVVEGEVVEGCHAVICAPSPPVANAEPATLGQVLAAPPGPSSREDSQRVHPR